MQFDTIGEHLNHIRRSSKAVTTLYSGRKKKKRSANHTILKIGLILFGTVTIIISWGVMYQQLQRNKTTLLDELKRQQNNLTGVLAENLYQIVSQKQILELFALRWLTDFQQKSLDDITAFLYGERTFTRVVLYQKNGERFYQSSPLFKSTKQKREFKEHIHHVIDSGIPQFVFSDNDVAESLFQIHFLAPLMERERTKGAMLLELDMGYLLNLFQSIDLGKTGRIMIHTHAGDSLACFESGGLILGIDLPRQALTETVRNRSGSGIYSFSGSGAGKYHLTYLAVREFPFIVSVSQELNEFFSEFNLHKQKLIWTLTILSACCLLAVFLMLKLVDRINEYVHALSASNREKRALIQKLALEHKATTKAASMDALTELYNRRLFVTMAEQTLLLAKRNRLSYAVMFIDLDRFKKINDTLGHRVGDLLLKTVADRLKACTRESDIVARFGGDEFVIMLTDMPNEQNISPIAGKIISEISKPCENLDGHRINTSPSIGIAVYPRDGADIDTLLLHADAAMYQSKQSGRGRYSFFDASLNTVSIQKFELEQRMPAAIANDEFVLHYQPKVRLDDYRVIGLESLIRWEHPNGQLIFPSDFIEIAEETGLIVDLDLWVLNSACRQQRQWQRRGIEIVPVAVNVSPRELKDPTYAARFFQTLSRFQLKPDAIEIEITENAFIEKPDIVISNLNALFSGGVKIALDDFGKGFSSLDHIRSLPINTLKIDRSFVQDIRNARLDNPIVSSTIMLAKKLNLTVVAEGVETHEQLINLKVAGCDQVQGYFFSRPVPEKNIREFIISPVRSLAA